MSEIYLPQRIIFGDESVKAFAQSGFESILIISNGGLPEKQGILKEFEQTLREKIPNVECIIGQSFGEIRDGAIKHISSCDIDRIIAVGSAELIDSAMLLSYQSGVDFAAVPYFSSCSMTDFDEARYRTYRKSPSETVLEPEFTKYIDSGAVAYDAFSCFGYAVDAMISCENSVIFSLALTGASEILNNIVGAYRGNCKSLQKLQYSMYCAVLAHRNMLSLNDSILDDATGFFAQLGISKQTSAAICIPELIDLYKSDIFVELCRAVGLCRSGEAPSDSVERLTNRVRSVQAALNIPRCIAAIRPERDIYKAFCENTHISRDILDVCYNGSFNFMKL